MAREFSISSDRLWINKALKLMSDAYGGNYILDKGGKKAYLKQAKGEPEANYNDRVDQSVFYNFTKTLIGIAAEKPFTANPIYSNDFPDELNGIKESFGEEAGVFGFAQKAFLQGLLKGQVGILPDFDKERKEPFCRLIQPENILGVWSSFVGGKREITRAQFIVDKVFLQDDLVATEESPQKSSEILVRRIFDLQHPNIVRIYNTRQQKDIKDVLFENDLSIETLLGEPESESVLKGFERIPFYLFQTEAPLTPARFMRVTPPFYDLAKMNFLHFNKQSDQDNIMRVSRFAILTISGLTEEESEKFFKSEKAIGPFTLLAFKEPQTKAYFAEHSGRAIESGFKDIIKIEKSMTSFLSDYLMKESVIETATEKTLQEQNKNLQIVTLAKKLERIITDCCLDFLRFQGNQVPEITEPLVSFASDYNPISDIKRIEALIKARQMGDLTLESFLKELAALKTFSSSFDAEKETQAVEKEAAENYQPPSEAPPGENPPPPSPDPPA